MIFIKQVIRVNNHNKLINLFIIICVSILCSTNLSAKEFIRYEHRNNKQKIEFPLSPSEIQWLKNHGPIKVAVKGGWMPIEFQLENQLHRGYSIDYLRKIATLYQINFEIVDFTDDFDLSQPDIISGVSGKNLADNDFQLLSQPFLSLPYAIYINKNTHKLEDYNDLSNIKSAKVALFKKSGLAKKVKDNYPKLSLLSVDIADEAFDYLNFGMVDAYVGNEFVVDYHIEIHRLNFVEKAGLTPFSTEVTMAVRKSELELISIMEKATMTFGQNNPALMSQWTNKSVDLKLILKNASGFILLVIVIFSIRLYQLKRKATKERYGYNEAIWRQANFDYLTQLPNRHQFQKTLEQSIVDAETHLLKAGLIFIDLDDFKHVNDTSGHSIGDELLQICAMRVTQCVRASDHTSRLGGDEFMVILTNFESRDFIESICKKLLTTLQKPFEIKGKLYHISASIGVTIYPDDGTDPEELVRYADQAMYESKKLGKNRYQYFNKGMQIAAANRAAMLNDIRLAILENQFQLYYQPIVSMYDSTVIKAEALIRWNHPKMGVIGPIEFIPLAEESGLIIELGNWIFDQATSDLQLLNKVNSAFQLSINVSPFQFSRPESLLNLVTLLNKKDIAAKQICLEITEGLLLEPTISVIDTLKSLSSYGIKFSIDDFGTGYSALGYLQNFTISAIKIDKSFTQNLGLNHFDEALCAFMIQLASKLEIDVIAEGVETSQQEAILNNLCCEYAQGYLYSKPMPLNRFIEYLSSQPSLK